MSNDPDLTTAKGVLAWAFNIRHPVKGTYKTGPHVEPIAESLARAMRFAAVWDDRSIDTPEDLWEAMKAADDTQEREV